MLDQQLAATSTPTLSSHKRIFLISAIINFLLEFTIIPPELFPTPGGI